jgi:hypothetical protein
MSAEEMETFERDPLFKEKLRLREYDEKAKIVDYKVPPLETYRDMIKRVMLYELFWWSMVLVYNFCTILQLFDKFFERINHLCSLFRLGSCSVLQSFLH